MESGCHTHVATVVHNGSSCRSPRPTAVNTGSAALSGMPSARTSADMPHDPTQAVATRRITKPRIMSVWAAWIRSLASRQDAAHVVVAGRWRALWGSKRSQKSSRLSSFFFFYKCTHCKQTTPKFPHSFLRSVGSSVGLYGPDVPNNCSSVLACVIACVCMRS